MQQKAKSGGGLYKFFIYFVLCMLAISIVVPVAWVFMASIKENRELYDTETIDKNNQNN